MKTPTGALSGIRVLDATQMLAGPLAGTRLGDLGADVIKLEPPTGGEFNRTKGFDNKRSNGEMTTFLAVNRNKRSLAIDLKSEAGRDAVLRLVEQSDVFIQNFKQGTAARLGVGYEQLREINPRLIYCSISGFGSSGPYRDKPGQDLIIQGYSGSMFSVGSESDEPTPSALWGPDVMTGYQAVIGILAAIEARHNSGLGQHVEVDMLSVVMDCQLQEIVTYLNTGSKPTRSQQKGAHASIPAPYGVYQTKDSWMILSMIPLPLLGEILEDKFLQSLSEPNDGQEFRDKIYEIVREKFITKNTEEWIQICESRGAWCGPVYDYESLVNDEHVIASNYIWEQPQIHGKSAKTVRPPIKLSDNPTSIIRGAPALGEHSREILIDLLGFNEKEFEKLVSSGQVKSMEV